MEFQYTISLHIVHQCVRVWYLDGGPLEIIWYGDQVQSVCEDLWLLGFSYLFLDSCLCFTLSSLHVNLFWVCGSLAFMVCGSLNLSLSLS